MTFFVLDDQDALPHQHKKVLLHRLRVVEADGPAKPKDAEDESRPGLFVLGEIGTTAQDKSSDSKMQQESV
jgi:hypothetical protein